MKVDVCIVCAYAAGSRSSSPSSRLSYLTNTQQDLGRRPSASATMVHGYNRPAMPRSQGSSREASPSRVHGILTTNSLLDMHAESGMDLVVWLSGVIVRGLDS